MAGKEVRDYGIGLDLSVLGLRVVLYHGHDLHGIHRPSPAISRRSLWQLRRWARGRDTLPEVLVGWWNDLPSSAHPEIRALVRAVSPLLWLALWWHATGGDEPQEEAQPEIEGPRVGV